MQPFVRRLRVQTKRLLSTFHQAQGIQSRALSSKVPNVGDVVNGENPCYTILSPSATLMESKEQMMDQSVTIGFVCKNAREEQRDKDQLWISDNSNPGAVFEVLGLVTERDFMMHFEQPNTEVSSIMTPAEKIRFVPSSVNVWNAMSLMSNNFIRHLPILDGSVPDGSKMLKGAVNLQQLINRFQQLTVGELRQLVVSIDSSSEASKESAAQ